MISLLLVSCGRTDNGVSTTGGTSSANEINAIIVPTPTDIPFELDPTKEAFKLTEIARESWERATAIAQFAHASPAPFSGIPTTQPYLEPVKIGLTRL